MATGFPFPRGCCLAFLVSHPIPCPVPLCHIPSQAHSQRAVVSLSPWAVVRPHPIPHPVFVPHRAASKPVARAHWILIHPGTVSCAWHGSLPSCPFPLCRVPSPFSAYFPAPHLPIHLGLLCGPSHSPFSVPSPFPIVPCLYPTGRPATLGCGPTGSSSILGPFRAPSTGGSLLVSPLSRPVTHLRLFPASCAFRFSWGRFAALATRPSLSCPLSPSSRVCTSPGRQQPFGAGPLDPHPSGDRFVCLALVAPFPPPSAWVVCFLQDLWWVLLPGPRFPRYPCLFPTWSPAVAVFFFARQPRSLICLFAPSRSLAACSLCALRPPVELWCFFFCPPLSRRASCPMVFSSLHARTSALHRSSGHRSLWCSSPVPSPSWGVALGGPWPCQVGAPPSGLSPLSPLSPPLSSVSCLPSNCCSPASCALRWSSPRQACISRALTRLRASALSSDL